MASPGNPAEFFVASEESGGDDSDEDLVTDYLDPVDKNGNVDASNDPLKAPHEKQTMAANPPPDSNVIPTISVTQHSPSASKAYCILEDNLRQLRGIQESIQRMRQVSVQTLRLQFGGKGQRGLGSISASCPSLNSVAANNNETEWLGYSLTPEWDSPTPPSAAPYWGGSDTPGKEDPGGNKRRRSWTSATERELEAERIGILYEQGSGRRRRSISLSSGDTDNEAEAGSATKITGTAAEMVDGLLSKHLLKSEGTSGNSSHSLNDIGVPLVLRSSSGKSKTLSKESAREKWLLSPRILTLQKSISTPSILAVKDGSTVAIPQLGGVNKDTSAGPISSFGRMSSYAGLESETEDELPLPDHASRFSLAEFPDPGYDNSEDSVSSKRRKRGSLFSRKRKDKDKDKGKKSPHNFVSVCHSNSHLCDVCSKSMTNKAALRCETCAITVHEHSCKDQTGDCTKFKVPKSFPSASKSITSTKSTASTSSLISSTSGVSSAASATSLPQVAGTSATAPTTPITGGGVNPFAASGAARKLSGLSQWKRVAAKLGVNKPGSQEAKEGENNPAEDAVTINTFVEVETVVCTEEVVSVSDMKDLDLDPELGVLDEEPESWVGTVDKKIAKKLKEKEVKRQEHIYEFITTEKHHCLTLKVMQKIFAEGMRRELNCPKEVVDRIFPCLDELLEYHLQFLRRLRQRQRQDAVVSTIEDILRLQFSGQLGDQLRALYGEFCSRHQEAVSLYKDYVKEDRKLAAFVRQCTMNPLCKKKGIPECILFVTQRITKYPLLIDPLIKTSREQPEECQKLQEVLAYVKDILIGVNAQVAEKERKQRLIDIYNKIDAKSATVYRNKKFKKSDLLSGNRRLMFEGVAYLNHARGKVQLVTVVVLSDVVFFLQESNQKFYFVSQDNKAGVISLQKLLIREKAGGQDTRGIYLISSNPAEPEMYELQCQNPKEKKQWIEAIRFAVAQCPEDDDGETGSDSEEQRKILEARTVKIRQLIGTMKEKDRDIANYLEEKMRVFSELVELLANNEDGVPASAPWSVTGTENGPKYSHLTNEALNSPVAKEMLLYALSELNRLLGCFYSGSSTSSLSLGLSRSVSSAGERYSEAYNLTPLPKRAETFGGFDHSVASHNGKEKGIKKKGASESQEVSPAYQNDYLALPSSAPLLGFTQEQQVGSLHVVHHVSTLIALLSSQATALESARAELLNDARSSQSGFSSLGLSKAQHKLNHNQRLEELRNLQDRLSKEKTDWLREKTQQEEQIAEEKKLLIKLQEQLRAEKTDIQQQRENLYQKLEALRSQGILLSPANMTIVTTSHVPAQLSAPEEAVDSQQHAVPSAASPVSAPSPPNAGEARRRTVPVVSGASSSLASLPPNSNTAALLTKRDSSSSLPLPMNLLSAKNEQKAAAVLASNPSIKQQLPMKLAKLASSNPGATSPVNASSSTASSNNSSSSSIVQQLLPLRLSESLESKRRITNQQQQSPSATDYGAAATKVRLSSSSFSPPPNKTDDFVVGHARTGSGPASISQITYRAQSYPRVPEKPTGLLKSSPVANKQQQQQQPQQQQKIHDPDTNQEIVFL